MRGCFRFRRCNGYDHFLGTFDANGREVLVVVASELALVAIADG